MGDCGRIKLVLSPEDHSKDAHTRIVGGTRLEEIF